MLGAAQLGSSSAEEAPRDTRVGTGHRPGQCLSLGLHWGTRAKPTLTALSLGLRTSQELSQPELPHGLTPPAQKQCKNQGLVILINATAHHWCKNQQPYFITWLFELFLFQCYLILRISSASLAQYIIKTFKVLLCQILQYVTAKWVKNFQMPLYPTICF